MANVVATEVFILLVYFAWRGFTNLGDGTMLTILFAIWGSAFLWPSITTRGPSVSGLDHFDRRLVAHAEPSLSK
jgi:hypothetical protein